MSLIKVGPLFNIGVVGRPHTYVVDDKIVQVGFRTVQQGNLSGERMFFTVLDKDGSVITPYTSLGDHLSFADYPNGFGQNVFHVGSDGAGGLVFHVSEFTNGFLAGGSFSPYAEKRVTLTQDAGGSLGSPVDVATGYLKFEDSDSADLSNGTVAILIENALIKQAQLQLMNADGTVISTTTINGSFDDTAFVGQGTRGLEVLQVGARILTLHRDPSTNTLYGQFFGLDGSTTPAGEFQISTGTHGNASFAAVWEDGVIDAAVLADGRVAVVWADSATGSDSTEVWLTILNANGSVSVPEALANVNATAGEQFHPRVHALDAGGFIVTFDRNNVPSTDARGFAQEFDASGAPIGDVLALAPGISTTGGTGYGHVFGDGTGVMIDWFGNAQLITAGLSGPTVINGTGRNDRLDGTDGADVISGRDGSDILKGLAGDDEIRGGKGTDKLFGNAGRDKLFGDIGNDRLNGGGDRDILRGGTGRDTLDGGFGNDVLFGDGGQDRFVFADRGGRDRIADFADDVDTLALDDALWGGGLTKQQVLSTYASIVGGDLVLDFGRFELTLDNFASVSALADDLVIF